MPRYKIRFRNIDDYDAALASEASTLKLPVTHRERAFISVEVPEATGAMAATRAFTESQIDIVRRMFDAEVLEDYQYALESADFDPTQVGPDLPGAPSLDDVLTTVRAHGAWPQSRGADVAIAIVDTGVDGRRPEFPAAKRIGAWQWSGEQPWTDWQGHGTMCATIAAGTRASGGAFDGVAPDAGLIACKTRFYDSELTAAYDYLTTLAQTRDLKIIASNSWGIKTGSPPPPPTNQDFPDALDRALAAGIIAVFSAGNYHGLTGGDPGACSPTSIWLHKCRADVLTVATCRLDDTMWPYSSRGPGQHAGAAGMADKPDVTAPTPANGRIVFGNDIVTMADGWGTSGACPQVAGLLALMRSWRPTLSRNALANTIRGTARALPHPRNCAGSGLIDCEAAVAAIA